MGLLIYWIFPLLTLALDYFAYKTKGTYIAVIFAVAGVGLLILGLPFINTPNTITNPSMTIITPNGNIIIPQVNETISNPNSIQSLSLTYGQIMIFPQFAYFMLIIAFWFTDNKNRRYRS